MLRRRRNGQFKRYKIWEALTEELSKPTRILMYKYHCSKSVVCSVRLARGLRQRTKAPSKDDVFHETTDARLLNQQMSQYEDNFQARALAGQLETGNPVIYTADNYSQEFLRGLIPVS